MGQPFPLVSVVEGMVRDAPRDQLPGGAVWNMVDWIPGETNYMLRQRGGWSNSTSGGLFPASTWCEAVSFAEFTTGTKVVAITNDGHARYTPLLGTWTDAGAAVPYIGHDICYGMALHRDVLIIPTFAGTDTPKWMNSAGTVAVLGGAPPTAKYTGVYKDHALLANASGFAQRVWLSAAGNPQSWDTSATGLWYDTSAPITGLATSVNAALIFHSGSTERLRGTTPGASGDIVLEPAFDVGCADPRSIAKYQNQIVWADTKGVYLSDGASIKDLTATGGMKTYWQNMIATVGSSTFTLAGGIIRNHYVVALTTLNASTSPTTFKDAFACDLSNQHWIRLSNANFRCFARAGSTTAEDQFVGLGASNQLGQLASIWTTTTGSDGDGNVIFPVLETGYFRGFVRFHRKWIPSQGIQNWRRAYVDYDCRGGSLRASFATSGDLAPTYTALTPDMPASTKAVRGRLLVNRASPIIAFKVERVSFGTDVRLFAVEADYEAREGSRLS